jgi:hypothetical protein
LFRQDLEELPISDIEGAAFAGHEKSMLQPFLKKYHLPVIYTEILLWEIKLDEAAYRLPISFHNRCTNVLIRIYQFLHPRHPLLMEMDGLKTSYESLVPQSDYAAKRASFRLYIESAWTEATDNLPYDIPTGMEDTK